MGCALEQAKNCQGCAGRADSAAARGGIIEVRRAPAGVGRVQVRSRRDDRVDPVEDVVRELDLQRPDLPFELLKRPRADDRRGDRRVPNHERERKVDQRRARPLRRAARAARQLRACAGSRAATGRSAPGMRFARWLWLSRPLRYAPESHPPASGLQGMTPMPWRSQVGSTSVSTPRTRIEYGGCSQT